MCGDDGVTVTWGLSREDLWDSGAHSPKRFLVWPLRHGVKGVRTVDGLKPIVSSPGE